MKKTILTYWLLSLASALLASIFLIIFYYGEFLGALLSATPCIMLLFWLIALPIAFWSRIFPPKEQELPDPEPELPEPGEFRFSEHNKSHWLLVALYCQEQKSASYKTLSDGPLWLAGDTRLPNIHRSDVPTIHARFQRLGLCKINEKSNTWLCKSYDELMSILKG